MTLREALAEPVDIRREVDPYPMPQHLWAMSETIDVGNISNVYARAAGRRGLVPDLSGGWFFADVVDSVEPAEPAEASHSAAAAS